MNLRIYVATLLLLVGSTACDDRSGSVQTSASGPPMANAGTAEPVSTPHYAHPGPEVPDPQVYFEPVDMSSAVGSSPLQISIHVNQGGKLSDKALAGVASEVALVTWPEMAAIESTKRTRRMAEGLAIAAFVTVVPVKPLSDRWYALKLTKLPAGVAWPSFAAHKQMDGGVVISRFRPGSDPQVASVQACDKEGYTRLVVDFSERITSEDARKITMSYAGEKATACGDWDAIARDGTMSLNRRCNSLDESAVLNVMMIRGASDSATEMRAPLQVDMRSMQQASEGCRIFRP